MSNYKDSDLVRVNGHDYILEWSIEGADCNEGKGSTYNYFISMNISTVEDYGKDSPMLLVEYIIPTNYIRIVEEPEGVYVDLERNPEEYITTRLSYDNLTRVLKDSDDEVGTDSLGNEQDEYLFSNEYAKKYLGKDYDAIMEEVREKVYDYLKNDLVDIIEDRAAEDYIYWEI